MRLPPFLRGLVFGLAAASAVAPVFADVALLNVSYDPTRELYQGSAHETEKIVR